MRFLSPLVALVAPSVLAAQEAVPVRYLTPDARIEARALTSKQLWPTQLMAVAADGRFIVRPTSTNLGIAAFEADGRASTFRVETGWQQSAEITWPERAGRFGKNIWIADPSGRQVAFVDANGKVTGALAFPSWVHPRWADRRKFPLFGSLQVIAVYPDSQLLVKGVRSHTLLDTPGFDRRISHWFRIRPDGQIQREIARLDDTSWRIEMRDGRNYHVEQVPFYARSFMVAADDGSRVAVLLPGTTAADSGSYRLISIDAAGDTVFSRRVAVPAVPVTQAQRDSVLRNVRGFGEMPADSIRNIIRKRMPAYRSFVTDVLAGNDQSTWIVTRAVSDTSQAREAHIIDPAGRSVARVALPVGFNPIRVDRDHAWGVDKANRALVRLKVQDTPAPTVAPPPRTAKASATKG